MKAGLFYAGLVLLYTGTGALVYARTGSARDAALTIAFTYIATGAGMIIAWIRQGR